MSSDELYEDGMKNFQDGMNCLLDVNHKGAQKAFTLAGLRYGVASKVAENPSEALLNAGIAFYRAGNWKTASDHLSLVKVAKLTEDERETLEELRSGVHKRLNKDFWDSLYRDYRRLIEAKDYDAVLDIFRTDPYLLAEYQHRSVLLHILGKKGLTELEAHYRAKFAT